MEQLSTVQNVGAVVAAIVALLGAIGFALRSWGSSRIKSAEAASIREQGEADARRTLAEAAKLDAEADLSRAQMALVQAETAKTDAQVTAQQLAHWERELADWRARSGDIEERLASALTRAENSEARSRGLEAELSTALQHNRQLEARLRTLLDHIGDTRRALEGSRDPAVRELATSMPLFAMAPPTRVVRGVRFETPTHIDNTTKDDGR